ncbi:MAG: LysR family transcriptional regulator [Clostridia bacterium]|nr:LysR family transcriptional regulator [Clostridia bacterium]
MENRFIRAEEVADELGVSKPYAYKLIRQLNEELKDKGFITIAGRVNRQYFNERLYGARKTNYEKSTPSKGLREAAGDI